MAGPSSRGIFLAAQEKDTSLQTIREPVRGALDEMEREITSLFTTPSRLLTELSSHVRGMPGKKFRPTLLLLVARLRGEPNREAIRAAAIIELIHTATLIHDDSIDQSLMRRGLPTINSLWSDRISVILGDYLYTKAFKALVDGNDWPSVAVLSRTAHRMTIGEMLQMEQKGDLGVTEDDYLRLIAEKTASLISAACQIGAIQSHEDLADHERFRAFGVELGMAYQITDDLFDFYGDAGALGKETASDLREGKITLPIIRALGDAPDDFRDAVAGVVETRSCGRETWERLLSFLQASGAFDYCRARASEYAARARAHLAPCEDGAVKDALLLAVDFATQRCH
jgi:octaprenyl-diphosphate synthase